jgi:uncharacterized ferritin-like protein (DUF455 family)
MSSRPSEPPAGTVERWCWDLIHAETLEHKLAPRTPPEEWEREPPARRVERPGRPPELRVAQRSARTPDSAARTAARAQLVHTFLHHELQAAELFAWAILAFPDTPLEFRQGLLRLCCEELMHLALYRGHLERLGHSVGEFAVRDWFWERVGTTPDAATFVALQGLGLEGANLEHSSRFAARFRAAGDDEGASILAQVERDEIAHVAFAVRWFERLTGAPLDYDRWRAALPAPLTPAVLQGRPLNRAARLEAGLDDAFLARLEAEPPTTMARGET